MVFPNAFQEALLRTVPGNHGHGHLQRLPAPRRRAAAEPAECLCQAVTEGRAQGPAPEKPNKKEAAGKDTMEETV